MKPAIKHYRPALLAACGAAALLSVAFGQLQFAGYDSSLLIDIGWRLHLGQHPYTDFPCMLPPSFYALSWLAVVLFGDHWYAFTFTNALVTMLLLCIALHAHRCMYPILTRQHRLVVGLYASAMIFPMLVTSHLWHSAFAAQTNTTLLFLLLFVFSYRAEHDRWNFAGLSYSSFAFCLVWLAKPNTGLACIALSILFPLLSRSRQRLLPIWLSLVASGFLLSIFVLACMSVSPLQVWQSYLLISNRPHVLTMLGDGIFYEQTTPASLSNVTTYVICTVLLVTSIFVIHRRTIRVTSPYLAVLVSGIAVSLVGFATNWDLKFNDLAPTFFGAGAFLTLPPTHKARPGKFVSRTLTACSILGMAMAIVLCCIRARMVSSGHWAETPPNDTTFHKDPFFGYFGGSAKFWQVLAQVDSLRAANPKASLYFGPRLEFLYAREHLAPPTDLPVWWHPGSSYPLASEPQIVRAWSERRYDLVLLDSSDDEGLRRLPIQMVNEFHQYYAITLQNNETLVVLRPR